MVLARSRRDFLKQSSALAALTAVGPAWAQTQSSRDVEADTAFGRVRGTDVDGIKTFKGIPYGASTAGANRFMPPLDPAKWRGVRDALEYGPSAPQREPGTQAAAGPLAVAGAGLPPESEDCLVLNVWTPGVDDRGKRPVMVWCHGGGFATGSGSSPGTDGTNLARRGDAVVVSINHRLNVLGFTYLAELRGHPQSGDAGMLDIVHALRWVRENIAEFGGDPNNVTVFGQSGGGRKVATLLAMPSAKGLFHRAIIESGATIKLVEREQAARVATALVRRLGLPINADARSLQGLPIDLIMKAYFATVRSMNVDQMTMGFSPTVDGSAVPMHPFHPTAADVSPDVPLIIGSTRTELTSSADDALFALDDAGMRNEINTLLGPAGAGVIDVYSKANPIATPSELYFLIASDHRYGAPVMKIAERRAELGKGAVYLYYFRWETPLDGGRLKSPHTIEIPFVFDNVKTSRLTADAPDAPALADKISDAWIAFARTGDPNTPKLPQWPKFDATNRATMVFDSTSTVVNDPIREQRLALFGAMGLTT
jgi:para-nitrobenzyl esterase